MERNLQVLIDIDGRPALVGQLWSRRRNGRESCTFAYDQGWIDRKGFALSPALPVGRGPQNTPHELFGVFADTAPDSWGRHLMHIDERARAKEERRAPRTLFGVDYLAGVNDETRMGALRFRNPGETQLLSTRGKPVPPVIDLPALMNAAMTVDKGTIRNADIRLVLDPGSALGGARPKAVVRDRDGRLLVAKFEKNSDTWPVIRWEAATLSLAREAGIAIPPFELRTVSRKAVLLMQRFDRRAGGARVHFMSAMSAIGANDHEPGHSYLELVEVIRQESDAPQRELAELWRRVVFNILVSNTDDHLRNHAFLWEGKGWRLSPAYDMNPTPISVRPRVHQIAIDDDDPTASLETAFSTAAQYGISQSDARMIAGQVGAAVARWREAAVAVKINKDQLEQMESAFDHADLALALKHRAQAPVSASPPRAKAASPKTAVSGGSGRQASKKIVSESANKKRAKKKSRQRSPGATSNARGRSSARNKARLDGA